MHHEPFAYLHHNEFPTINLSLRSTMQILFRQVEHKIRQQHFPFQAERPLHRRHHPFINQV